MVRAWHWFNEWRSHVGFFSQKCNLSCSKAFYYHPLYNLSLFHSVVYFKIAFSLVIWFLYLQYVCQSVGLPDFNCRTFCLIPLNNKHFKFLINPRGFNTFYSHFLNGCMLIMYQVQYLVAPHYTPQTTSSTYESQKNLLYDLLYTILGRAFGTLIFLAMAIILWSIHPMDLDTALKQISAALVKMWSMHVDDLIPVLFELPC